MSDADPIERRGRRSTDGPQPEPPPSGFIIPKGVLIAALAGIVIGMPASIWGVSWYMSGQSSDAKQTTKDVADLREAFRTWKADDFANFKTDTTKKLDAIGSDVRVITDASNRTEVRLGKIDSSLSYLANTAAPPPAPTERRRN